jgi:hypothetical protein
MQGLNTGARDDCRLLPPLPLLGATRPKTANGRPCHMAAPPRDIAPVHKMPLAYDIPERAVGTRRSVVSLIPGQNQVGVAVTGFEPVTIRS